MDLIGTLEDDRILVAMTEAEHRALSRVSQRLREMADEIDLLRTGSQVLLRNSTAKGRKTLKQTVLGAAVAIGEAVTPQAVLDQIAKEAPEYAVWVDVKSVRDTLRRMSKTGEVELITPGIRGQSGRAPIYRAVAVDTRKTASSAGSRHAEPREGASG